jgi:hypothetical protein
MKDINNLLIDIKSTQAKYDKIRDENRFNIFSALHKEHDEVNLHSRFISYLLASDSGHRMSNVFCEILVREILKIDKTQFNLSNYIVLPNERVKSEYKEIDILIMNKKSRQAIIIENKIFAKDSNKKKEDKKNDGYDGQLERYYNTIKKGIDKNGNDIQDFQCNTVFIYYLTMFKEKQPSDESIGELKTVKVIYYSNEIKNWIEKCIDKVPNDKSIISQTIQQYLNLINKMTHNDIPIDERLELRSATATNWKSAKYLIENFKHIKWHTVSDFWNILKTRLESEYENVSLYPDDIEKQISEITHNNRDINIGILFDIDDNKKAYISSLGNLNWGILEPKKWMIFNGEITENIRFSDFSTENTFRLIDKQNIEKTIDCILKEIKAEKENDLNNLKIE